MRARMRTQAHYLILDRVHVDDNDLVTLYASVAV